MTSNLLADRRFGMRSVRMLMVLVATIALACSGGTVLQQHFYRERCDDAVVEIVDRYASTPMDTLVTVEILADTAISGEQQRQIRTCVERADIVIADSGVAVAYLHSRLIPCISGFSWVRRITLRNAPLPLPMHDGRGQ